MFFFLESSSEMEHGWFYFGIGYQESRTPDRTGEKLSPFDCSGIPYTPDQVAEEILDQIVTHLDR
jgi:hypothetical protein